MPEPAEPADPRLAELTEQALHLLEELAEARLRAASLPELEARCRQLEERLAETRRHVRSTRTVRLAAPHSARAGQHELDVYLWTPVGVTKEDRDRWLLRLETALARRPATLLCRADERPTPETLARLPSLRVLDCDGKCSAQLWNLGVASGGAPLVLFLACGAHPTTALTADEYAAALDESVVLAQPVLTVKGQSPSLGLREERGLVLRPEPMPASGTSPVEVPELAAVAPEVFFVQRETASHVGPFDEDMQGNLALLEFALRGKALGYLVVGLPRARVDLPFAPGRGLGGPTDRIVLLARHRPGEALRALVAEPLVWERPEPELKAFLRAVLQRLPNVAGEGVGVLADELAGLRQGVVAVPVLAAHAQALERVLNDALGIAVPAGRGPVDLRVALEQAVDKARRLAALDDEHGREAELAKGRLGRVEQEAAAQKTRAEAAASELGEARRALQAREGELAAALARADRLAHEVTVAQAGLRELVANADATAQEAQRRHDEFVAVSHHRYDEVLAMVTDSARTVQDQKRELDEVRAKLAAESSELGRIGTVLRERERWIGMLLEELSRRGLKLRPRKLSPEEERFLAEQRARR